MLNSLGNGNIPDFWHRLPTNVQALPQAFGYWRGRALYPWYRVTSIDVGDAVADFE